MEQIRFAREFFEKLAQIDRGLAAQVAAARCPRCGGALHRSDYSRKPREAVFAGLGADACRRFSLCCGREGCRRRATPPSVRFLGRRVYVGAVVVIVSVLARLHGVGRALARAVAVPVRTIARWRAWWTGPFTRTAVFAALRARLGEVAAIETVPACVWARLGADATTRTERTLHLLAPLTTTSVPDASRFLRVVV